jgi:hypothetical protein
MTLYPEVQRRAQGSQGELDKLLPDRLLRQYRPT